MDQEHSILLKYFIKEDRPISKTNMSDTPIIKIEKEYRNPPNIESEVPGTHEIRGANKNIDTNNSTDEYNEITVTEAQFTLSPVITVTKNESTFTKGDLKLQKVTVEEDISVSYKHLFKKNITPGKSVVTSIQKLEYNY
ncbi:hypothetical protein HW555_006077 [Spodoptera exigua]|uniref:Uncharacterized protein n=1 Tax=Spodoptera exigua TaxID=7107 RepID=A0A835GFC2_SPOEX|nr:hypothetical protein HW555_006077 [Spodoptera exigua]